ncbi:MAG: hypothetical protein K6C36_00415 [Clostridia bacterium]|nr:hypothetical protein [Clostridia bacterium]
MSFLIIFRRAAVWFTAILMCVQSFFAGIRGDTYMPKSGDFTAPSSSYAGTADFDSPLSGSVALASSLKNGVQCAYTDPDKSGYRMANQNMVLTHTLGKVNTATLTDPDGNVYIKNGFDCWSKNTSGGVYSSSVSSKPGRVNSVRLGIYYWECHVRDLYTQTGMFRPDKTFHVYSDRLYLQYSMFADEATDTLDSFGMQTDIPVSTVEAVQIRDKDGVHSDLDFDPQTVEYAAFDIKDVGVAAFIIPADGSTAKLEVSKLLGSYSVVQTAAYESGSGINKYDETGDHQTYCPTFGCRVYTDRTHDFAGVEKASFEERNPLTVTVNSTTADAQAVGYEPLRGTYRVTMTGTGFNEAYYEIPDFRFEADLSVSGDGSDRGVFLRVSPDCGMLEGAAVYDENRLLVPIDCEVCKNFQGDYGDRSYSYVDYSYSDIIFPAAFEEGKDTRFIVQELYQNWGKVPLKQLSSIEFHTSYYHLSTGVTETNCIAPYGADLNGWLLPDFRCASGTMWSGQPQFNSQGQLYFCVDRRTGAPLQGAFTGNTLDSVGQTYADATLYFLSPSGDYKYSLRHMEFPQTDENRTYYTIDLEFLRDASFSDVSSQLDLFYMDGRFVRFESLAYLDSANNSVLTDIGTNGKTVYPLGSEAPYFSFLSVCEEYRHYIGEGFGCNVGVLVRNATLTRGGETTALGLAVRDDGAADKTSAALTIDGGGMSFEKGDRIRVDMILLPWGTGLEETPDNVLYVREDSLLAPLTAQAETAVLQDGFLTRVRAENNSCEFTLSGGRNSMTVSLDGFSVLGELKLFELVDGEYTAVTLSGPNGHDGYSVHVNEDGTLSYSFVYAAGPDTERSFRAFIG